MTTPKKLKVMTVLGTRPEIIRLASTIKALDKNFDHVLVHTGQNYDYELNEIFMEDLGLKMPDHFLEVDTSSLGATLGGVLSKTEEVLIKEKPDAMLILGDTNSSIAGIIAKRYKVPVYHMEAGNRSFDMNVPEEINRRIIDHVADFNLVYTEHARRHLLSEGLQHRRIYLTGSPMYEVLHDYKEKIESSTALNDLNLKAGQYFVVSIHREENVDHFEHLESLVQVLNGVAARFDCPVIVSTHPRTRKRLDEHADKLSVDERVQFMKPMSFTSYVKLQQNALCTLSDSGTISEESAILDFPAVTVRNSMERPEALDAGTIVLTGLDTDVVLNAIDYVVEKKESGLKEEIPHEYRVNNVSHRVCQLILGTAKLSNRWAGIVVKKL